MSGSLIFVPSLEALFLLLNCLVQLLMWWFFIYLIILYFAMFCCCLLIAGFFSNERRKGSRSIWEGVQQELERVEGSKNVFRLYCMEIRKNYLNLDVNSTWWRDVYEILFLKRCEKLLQQLGTIFFYKASQNTWICHTLISLEHHI